MLKRHLTCFVPTGVQTSACGERALRLRPALIAERHHADIFLDTLEGVLHDERQTLAPQAT